MQLFNSFVNNVFDLILDLVRSFNPFWSLFVLSLPISVLLLLIFRHTSDQKSLKETKDRIKGHMLELRLFRDNPRISISAFGNILFYNLKYMKSAVRPMLFMILPVVIVLIQLDSWYGNRPLWPGETSVFSLKLNGDDMSVLKDITIRSEKGVTVDVPPLRIADTKEINWRIQADEPGDHVLAVEIQGKTIEKTVTVSRTMRRVSKNRPTSDFFDVLFNPGEKPLPEESLVKQISIDYPARTIGIFGWKTHWLVVFTLVTIIFGFLVKGFFKVEL